jgi:hypothetical protein
VPDDVPVALSQVGNYTDALAHMLPDVHETSFLGESLVVHIDNTYFDSRVRFAEIGVVKEISDA